MSLRECFQILKSWWVFILCVSCMAMLVSGILSCYFIEKYYCSSITFFVSNKVENAEEMQSNFCDILPDERLIRLYKALIQSDAVIEKVIEDLKITAAVSDLKKRISLNTIGNNGVIKITVEDKSPELAQKIAGSIVEKFKAEADRIKLSNNVDIIDHPKLPRFPEKPRLILNIVLAGIIGVATASLYVFITESYDDSIKSLEHAANYFGLPILGTIPVYKKKKRKLKNMLIAEIDETNNSSPSGSVENPISEKLAKNFKISVAAECATRCKSNRNVAEAFRLLAAKMDFKTEGKISNVIVVTGSGGGEGKTAAVINLAAAMTEMGKKVLLVDGNIRKSDLSAVFKMDKCRGLTNVISDNEITEEDINLTEGYNLGVIGSGPKAACPCEVLESPEIRSIFAIIRQYYDVIIVDSPPVSYFADALALSRLADGIILVARMKKSRYKEISKAVNNLNSVSANILGMVVTDTKE